MISNDDREINKSTSVITNHTSFVINTPYQYHEMVSGVQVMHFLSIRHCDNCKDVDSKE